MPVQVKREVGIITLPLKTNSTFHKVRIQRKDYYSLGYRQLGLSDKSALLQFGEEKDFEWYREFFN